MKTIHLYIGRSYLVSFLTSLLVITFVMSIGGLFKMTELLARGVSFVPVLQLFLFTIPYALGFAVPISALVSALLVFGRFSADGEITAMRSCGISLWQIIRGPLYIAFLLVVVCVYINSEILPWSHLQQRTLAARLGSESPADLLEEGRFQDFGGMMVYVGRKKDHELQNVRIYENKKSGLRREIVAKRGAITTNGTDLVINLFDVRIEPFSEDIPGPVFIGETPITVEDAFKARAYTKKKADQTLAELLETLSNLPLYYPRLRDADLIPIRSALTLEIHERFVMAVACFAFVFLGMPLGIKAHRKESSIGVAISLFLVFNFYLFVIIAESLQEKPEYHPVLLIWSPVIISMILGTFLIRRAN